MQLSGRDFLGGSVTLINGTSAPLPMVLGCELWVLQLQHNLLSGSMTEELSDLSQLVSLNLAYNGITGT